MTLPKGRSKDSPLHRSCARSRAIFEAAQKILVGGVDSPVRAFKAVGGEPLVVERAAGSRIYDADGNEYIDYVCSWGAMILGHAHPAVTAAIQDQAARGTSYGMTTELEAELARAICRAMPSLEMIRFVSSGTEATMSAVRLARAFTRRDFIVKFDGGYHGHADSFLSQAGSGLATLGIASSPGVPDCLAQLTLNAPYNDAAAVEKLFDAHRGQIAAVIVEPVAANMGVVPPAENFLRDLRDITQRHGALLIFDEVITGFRLARGGAQEVYGIQPDFTTLGKIIGGGLPVGAFGGRAEVMKMIAPLGPVYQAGTLSGNPLAMRAGIETLKQLEAPGFYEQLNGRAERLVAGMREAIAKWQSDKVAEWQSDRVTEWQSGRVTEWQSDRVAEWQSDRGPFGFAQGGQGRGARGEGRVARVNAAGSLLTLFFTGEVVGNYESAKKADTYRFGEFFLQMLERGILLPPSQYEALFVSAAHSDADVERTIEAVGESLKAVASS